MTRYVKLDDVNKVLETLRERDMYHDFSKKYEEKDIELTLQIKQLRRDSVEGEII